MAIERLNRIRWRLRELGKPTLSVQDLRGAIMREAGTDPRTIQHNIDVMLELKLIARVPGEFGKPETYTLGSDTDC